MHVHTISPTVHLAATFAKFAQSGAGAMFAKPGEAQLAAVKRYMAARKRAWHSTDARTFPRFAPGVTSVLSYAHAYYADNPNAGLGEPTHLVLSDRPQGLHDDTVQLCEVDADAQLVAA